MFSLRGNLHAMPKRTRTASELLTIWGLVTAGGRLTDVIRKLPTGEAEAEDDEQLAAIYVQTTPGYFKALPVLRHVYAYHHPLPSFDPTMPGETLQRALERLEWRFLSGLPLKVVGPSIHEEFLNRLTDRTKAEPFYYWQDPEERFSAKLAPAY